MAHYKIVQWFASYPCVSSPLNPILHPLPPPLKHNSPLLHTLLTQFHTPVQFNTLNNFTLFLTQFQTFAHYSHTIPHSCAVQYSRTIPRFFSHNSTLLHTFLTQFHTPVQFNTLVRFHAFSQTIPRFCTLFFCAPYHRHYKTVPLTTPFKHTHPLTAPLKHFHSPCHLNTLSLTTPFNHKHPLTAPLKHTSTHNAI